VHFAGADGQVDATEDFFLLDAGVQVLAGKRLRV
jgi:hypothetical protein